MTFLTQPPPDFTAFPLAIREFISGAPLFDSSCSVRARVTFVDKDQGFFLKTAAKGSLHAEAEMTRYFHSKGLAAEVITYISDELDWLLTTRILGEDCTSSAILEQPERLCDLLAECLLMLHNTNFSGCPVSNCTERLLTATERNYRRGQYDQSLFPDNWGYASAEDAWRVVETQGHLLQTNTLLHGDYCLPNIILHNWSLGGFIDLGDGGVGDLHVDVFWAIWSLAFNLKTDQYRQRFIDVYGRSKVNEDTLRLIAAIEVFG